MFSFKEQLKKDLDIFINPNEFAGIHTIDGDEHPCIFESIDVTERDRYPQGLFDLTQGIYKNVLVLSIKSNLIRRPGYDQEVNVDGQIYYVKGVIDQMGILNIVLEMNEV